MKVMSPPNRSDYQSVQAVVFDFDGTLSTFRSGWESVMRDMMLEFLSNGEPVTTQLELSVDSYIDSSTGIQTVHQMEWLKEQVEKRQNHPLTHDVWWYKRHYTSRLKEVIRHRLEDVQSGNTPADEYLIAGAKGFLTGLAARNVKLFLASGTDHPDVVNEADILGVYPLFADVKGAPVEQIGCSKETVIRTLIHDMGYQGEELLIVGDGRVEIELGLAFGAITLGVASDEVTRHGINPAKERRLTRAGAHAIIGDFLNPNPIYAWLNM